MPTSSGSSGAGGQALFGRIKAIARDVVGGLSRAGKTAGGLSSAAFKGLQKALSKAGVAGLATVQQLRQNVSQAIAEMAAGRALQRVLDAQQGGSVPPLPNPAGVTGYQITVFANVADRSGTLIRTPVVLLLPQRPSTKNQMLIQVISSLIGTTPPPAPPAWQSQRVVSFSVASVQELR